MAPQRSGNAQAQAAAGTAPALSRELIIRTALHLLDRRGPQALNMRAIAEELGVRASALYRHVSGKAGVLAGIRSWIALSVADPRNEFETLPWDEALRNWAYRYRGVFAEHPNAVPLLGVTPFTDEAETIAVYEGLVLALTRAGWEPADALDIANVFDSFLLGSALDLAASEEILTAGSVPDAPAFSAAVRLRRERNARGGVSAAEAAFAAGVDLLLSALRAQEEARGPGSGHSKNPTVRTDSFPITPGI